MHVKCWAHLLALNSTIAVLFLTGCNERSWKLGWFVDPQPTPTPTISAPAATSTQADIPDVEPTATPTLTPDPRATSTPLSPPDSDSDSGSENPDNGDERRSNPEALIKRLLVLVDDYRLKNDLLPLKLSDALSKAAQSHAEEMAKSGDFSAQSADGSNAGARLLDAGYIWQDWGENLATGYTSPEAVMDAWKKSSVHRTNLLHNQFTEIGIGYFEKKSQASNKIESYWVQELATPRDDKDSTEGLTNFR